MDRDESLDLAVPRADKLQELVTEWERHLDEFTELASRDLPADVWKKVKDAANYSLRSRISKRRESPNASKSCLVENHFS